MLVFSESFIPSFGILLSLPSLTSLALSANTPHFSQSLCTSFCTCCCCFLFRTKILCFTWIDSECKRWMLFMLYRNSVEQFGERKIELSKNSFLISWFLYQSRIFQVFFNVQFQVFSKLVNSRLTFYVQRKFSRV